MMVIFSNVGSSGALQSLKKPFLISEIEVESVFVTKYDISMESEVVIVVSIYVGGVKSIILLNVSS